MGKKNFAALLSDIENVNVHEDKPCKVSSIGAVSWTTALGDVGGGGALRLVLFSEDSAEDPRLKPAIYGAQQD